MLNEALTAIAAAGGTAVVQAIGTDVWMLVRGRVGVLLGRGDATREQAVLTRLDRTAGELEQAPDGHDAIHTRLEDSWRTRFEDFLDELPPEAQNEALQSLRDVVALGGLGRGSTSAGSKVWRSVETSKCRPNTVQWRAVCSTLKAACTWNSLSSRRRIRADCCRRYTRPRSRCGHFDLR